MPPAASKRQRTPANTDATPNTTGSAAQQSSILAGLAAARNNLAPLQGRPRIVLWLLLTTCLTLAAILGLVNLTDPVVTDADETLALASFSETYNRYEGIGPAKGLSLIEGLVPHLHGQALDKPPALTWMQIALAKLSTSPLQTPDDFILIGRMLSCILMLVSVACIFWAGHCIGGHRTAFFAGLLAAVNPFMIHYGRLASPTIAITAMTMLAIASALWAIRPLRASPSVTRQGLGWGICGIAMAAAAFIVGLGAVPVIVLSIMLILLLCPNRVSHLMGLIAAMLITALMIVSWIAVSQALALGVPWWWSAKAFISFWDGQGWDDLLRLAWQTPLWILAAVLPWSLWLVGAIIQPFSTSSSGTRLRMFLSWAWFMLALLLLVVPLSLPGASLLILAAAACVFIGQLFNQYIDLARSGRFVRFWRLLKWPHLLLIAAGSVALPLWFYFHPQMLQHFGISLPLFATPPRWASISLGVILLGLTALSARWTIANFPGRALLTWVGWTFAVLLTLVLQWSHGPRQQQPMHQLGQELAAVVQKDPVYWVKPHAPHAGLVFYSQVFPVPIEFEQLTQLRQEQQRFFLLADSDLPIFNNNHTRLLRTVPGSLGLWLVQKEPITPSQ